MIYDIKFEEKLFDSILLFNNSTDCLDSFIINFSENCIKTFCINSEKKSFLIWMD